MLIKFKRVFLRFPNHVSPLIIGFLRKFFFIGDLVKFNVIFKTFSIKKLFLLRLLILSQLLKSGLTINTKLVTIILNEIRNVFMSTPIIGNTTTYKK